MISTAYVKSMAAYNRWQNGSLYAAAATLSDAEPNKNAALFSAPFMAP